MADFVSYEDAVTPPAKPTGKGASATGEVVSYEDALGLPREERNIFQQVGDFITDPTELKGMAKRAGELAGTAGKVATATADMLLGLPGQAASVATDIYTRGEVLARGQSRAERDELIRQRKAQIPEGWTAPLQSLQRLGGVSPLDQSIVTNTIEKGAQLVDKYSGGLLTDEDAKSVLETVMFVGFAKVPGQAVKQAMAPKQRLGMENRATYAPEPVTPPPAFEPRGIAPRGQTPVPLAPEEAVAQSKKRIAESRKAFQDKEAAARMEELANARQVKQGDALMGDETVQVTGEPVRGEDGRLYTPIVRNGTAMEVPSADLAVKPQLGLERLTKQEPLQPSRELGQGGRIMEGTVIGQKPSFLETALEKERAGQNFNFSAEEAVAMRALTKAQGRIVGVDGKPLSSQAGQVDPRLLAALGIGSAATFLALNPDEIEKLGTVGLIGATMLGKDRALSALKEHAAPYSYPTLDFLAKQHGGKTEFGVQQVLDASKKASAEEQAVIRRVVGDKKTITSDELVGGLLEETAGWKFTPEKTPTTYDHFGLGRIGRAAEGSERISEGGIPVPKEAQVTTRYRLPEFMQVSDANHFKDSGLFGWVRSFKEDGMRHVVEIQSDLAQKLSGIEFSPEQFKDLIGQRAKISKEIGELESRVNDSGLERAGREEALTEARKARLQMAEIDKAIQTQADASQVSPIVKNWPRRLIREELAQAAEGGEGSVRFASADTVAKVEGWRDAAVEGQLKPEHQRIYNRYAGEITRYLKGLGGKEVTDATGNTWIEVPTSSVMTPKGPRVQQLGQVNPELLVTSGAVTGGAAIGALVDPEHPLKGAIYGALAGGLIGTKAGREAASKVLKSPDAALGVISTRLGHIAPELKYALRNHELRVLKETERMNDAALPFLQALQKLSAEQKTGVERALLNGDLKTVQAVPELAATYPKVQGALKGIAEQLKGLGRFSEGVSDYFPRIVKDFEGLKKALGQEAAQGLEKALIDAEAKMIRKEGRSLTDVEESVITNRYLYAPDQTSFQPGFAKARRLKEVPENLQQFYEPPAESLLRYLSGAVRDLETAKFFGRDLKTSKKGGGVYTDVDSSIGNMTARLLADGKITHKQAMELRDILKARFEGGEKGMNSGLATVRNLTNTALLGNVASAATQVGDSLATIYHHGLVPTAQAIVQKVVGKERVTPKQLGLVNHIAEELSEMGPTGRALQVAMKYSGFHAIDMFAKGLALNASLNKNARLVQSPKGEAAFRAKYEPAFGEETGRVIEDLKAGRRSDATDQLAFSELSDAQPVSKAEMPELYLKHPNGRFLYQLKTYMLKQADVVRRDAYDNIRKGTSQGIKDGTKALMGLATMYAFANVPGDVIKDWMSGRKVDVFSTPKLVENVLQTFGVNRYAAAQIGKGKVVETAVGMATPPVRVLQDIAKGDSRAVGYIPFVGRPLADRYFGGNERREIYETGLHNKTVPKSQRKKLSSAAKRYLSEKKLENSK